MKSLNITKRILVLCLASWIAFTSVFFAYQESCHAAEWIAGAVAAIGGAPIVTALVIGGVVVAGGIALHELSQTDAQDHATFLNGLKDSFTGYCEEQAIEEINREGQITDQGEIIIEAGKRAGATVKNFWDNAVNATVTTGSKLKASAVEKWKLFSAITANVADVGLSSSGGGVIDPDTRFRPSIINYNSGFEGITATQPENIGSNTQAMDGRSYIVKGTVTATNFQNVSLDFLNSTYLTIPILFAMPYVDGNNTYLWTVIMCLQFERSTGNYLGSYKYNNSDNLSGDMINMLNNYIGLTNISIVLSRSATGQTPMERANELCTIIGGNKDVLAVGNSDVIPSWKRTLNNTLSNTHIGQAIQTGRRQLVNDGDEITSVFETDAIPAKKTGVTAQDGVITAPVGWDIPAGGVYDDVFKGTLPWRDVVDGVGAVEIPIPDIIDKPDGGTKVKAYEDTRVNDPSKPEEDPEDPEVDPEDPEWGDVIEDQGGPFYPAQMDLTSIFPFCIPFDIIYLVQKFGNVTGVPPRLEFPIVYPQALQPVLGESYVVVVDFADYVTIRNIIRVFLLLLFIIGLMQITRQIIRG